MPCTDDSKKKKKNLIYRTDHEPVVVVPVRLHVYKKKMEPDCLLNMT